MIPPCIPTTAAQKEAFSLAGMFNGFTVNLTKPNIETALDGIYATVRACAEGFSIIATRGREDLSGVTTRDKTVSVSQRLDNSVKTLVNGSFATSTRSGIKFSGTLGIEFSESIKKDCTEFRDKYARYESSEFCESIKKGSTLNATPLITADSYQPFGSMPRDCSSLRIMRLIQAARDSSPSNCWAASINTLSSGSSLNWNGGLPLRSFLCVDMLATPIVMYICVMTHYYHMLQKTMPRSGGTLTGHLTTTVITSNEEAILNNTTHPQGRNAHTLNNGELPASFIWLIAAVRRDCQQVTVKIYHIDAKSEHEARQTLSREHVTFFAGRIRKGVAA